MSGLFAGTPWERPVTCQRCEKALDQCACPRDSRGQLKPPRDQPARVRREKRGGKIVTVVTGLDPVASDLPGLLKRFKSLCAAGGTLRDRSIEIQGDQRDKLVATLCDMGYPAKAAGG